MDDAHVRAVLQEGIELFFIQYTIEEWSHVPWRSLAGRNPATCRRDALYRRDESLQDATRDSRAGNRSG
jgi:hypothetical protein